MTTYSQIIAATSDNDHPADQLDQAANRSQQEVDHLIRENAARVAEQEAAALAQVTGECLHCDGECEPPRRWCDKMCRDSYEAEQKAAVRRGY